MLKKTRQFSELFNDELVNAYSEFESVFERITVSSSLRSTMLEPVRLSLFQ
jgi:hypothetical protein